MNPISVRIPFDSSKEEILESTKKLVSEVYKGYLGHEPTTDDIPRFIERINSQNGSVNDMYFNRKKYGTLATTFIVDSPQGISFDFTPED
jgi:hypothetical protein